MHLIVGHLVSGDSLLSGFSMYSMFEFHRSGEVFPKN